MHRRLRALVLRPSPAMSFLIVCVAPGASDAQVVELANSIGDGWWAFDTLPTTVSEWWRRELLELKTGFMIERERKCVSG